MTGPHDAEAVRASDRVHGLDVPFAEEMRLKEEAHYRLMRERARAIAAEPSAMLPDGLHFEYEQED